MSRFTAETFCEVCTGVTGWCVKDGDDTVCDVYAGEEVARKIAALLNAEVAA